jgi:MFS family permease
MQTTIVVGVLIGQLAAFPACKMDDEQALGKMSEAVHLQEEQEKSFAKTRRTCYGLIGSDRVVHVMFTANLIMGLGAGMTVKFYPIFFKEEVKLDPATLQVMFSSLVGVGLVGTLLAERVSRSVGRLQIIIPCIACGVCATSSIGLLDSWGHKGATIMLPLFIFRCFCMWSTMALQGSVVADYTPKSQRGRWKALNSVTALGWSGSAAVGGWLIDKYGYGFCFISTACLQALSIPLLCMLMPHVANELDLRARLDVADAKQTPLLAADEVLGDLP